MLKEKTLPSQIAPAHKQDFSDKQDFAVHALAASAFAGLRAASACSECGQRGPVWANPGFGDVFCLPCLQAYIAWEEAELTKARAALLLLTACRRRYAA